MKTLTAQQQMERILLDEQPQEITLRFKGARCYVAEEFRYRISFERDVCVPKDYKFNGASIPWWAWSILRVDRYHPKAVRAAAVHDWLYDCGEKRIADRLFYRMLREGGIDVTRAKVMYWAVCVAGKAGNPDA